MSGVEQLEPYTCKHGCERDLIMQVFSDEANKRLATLEAELAAAREAAKAYIVFRSDVLEEAAKVAEARHDALGLGWTPHAIARAIRALAGGPTA